MKFYQGYILAIIAVGWSLLASPGLAYPPAGRAEPFYMGVYLYEYHLAKTAKELNQDYFTFLEHHLKILQNHEVNAVYLGGASRDRFGREVKLFAKYGISVIPQLDFAYYQPKWNDKTMAAAAKRAANFIRQYADEPNVLAFSVREEVPHSGTNGLARYYAAILADAPEARFQLINNNLGSATDLPVPDPVIMGTDRYAFWWEFSGGGYLASPDFSLNWVRQQADRYYWQAARRGADFSLVVTQGGAFTPASANKYAGDGKITYPKTNAEQEKLRRRIRTFAADGRMGWAEFDTPFGKRYNVWKYYRLPKNCMKALAWTAVLQGGKSFYVWSYSPRGPEELKLTYQNAVLKKEIPRWGTWTTLAGRPGKPNPQFDEFAEAAEEIRPYGKIITRMSRTDQSLIQCDQKQVFHNAFMLPSVAGCVVVIQNSNVGTWPGDSARFFKDADDIRIDNNGNLVGYKGFDKPLDVKFTLKDSSNPSVGVFDVLSGKKLPLEDSAYHVSIAPGSGTLVFIGTEEAARPLRQGMTKQ